MKESYFIFNIILYKQIYRVTMGSPLGPSWANSSLTYHEQNWLHKRLLEHRPLNYQWYVNDIFVIFKIIWSLKKISKLLKFLSCQHIIYYRNWTEKQNIRRCQCYSPTG